MSEINRLKQIQYQYLKDLNVFDPSSLTDEKRIEHTIGIVNAIINSGSVVTDAEMPTTLLGTNLNWAAGAAANDYIVDITLGDYSVLQDLTQVNQNVRLRMPTNLTATNNVLEESVELTWTEVPSASGYKVVRNFGEADETTILDGNSGYTVNAGTVSFIDNVGDNLEHTYVVLAKDADPNDNSTYTEAQTGKGWSLQSYSVNRTSYGSQTVSTSSSAFDITLSNVDISGGSGHGGRALFGGNETSGGNGGRGYNYNSPTWSGSHTFAFQCGSNGYQPQPGSGYHSGGSGGTFASSVRAGGGGGASRITIDGSVVCGAGGGGGGSASSTAGMFGGGDDIYHGGGGGGVNGEGSSGGENSGGSGGSGGGGNGSSTLEESGNNGSAVALQGNFSNVTTSSSPHCQATLTWKE